jgi:hypothetical protein
MNDKTHVVGCIKYKYILYKYIWKSTQQGTR